MNVRCQMFLGLAALAALGYTVVAPAHAQDTKKTEQKTEQKASNQQDGKDAKMPENGKALQNLELASELIRYGRQEKHPESLLLAAQIIHKTPTIDLKGERTGTGKGDAKAPKNTPTELVAEAKKLSSAPTVVALATATEKLLQESTRGAEGGPRSDIAFPIAANGTVTWKPIRFVGGQRAEAYIELGVFTNMVLEVTDENGNLIARDNVPGSFYRCVWTPRWTGPFTIRLISFDNRAFVGSLYTN